MHRGMIPFCLAIPPKNGQRRSLISGLRIATLSFVVKMQWIFREQNVLAMQGFCITEGAILQHIRFMFLSIWRFSNVPLGRVAFFLIDTGAKAPAYYHRVPPGRARSRRLAFGVRRSALSALPAFPARSPTSPRRSKLRKLCRTGRRSRRSRRSHWYRFRTSVTL
jgi:hypothetical protein